MQLLTLCIVICIIISINENTNIEANAIKKGWGKVKQTIELYMNVLVKGDDIEALDWTAARREEQKNTCKEELEKIELIWKSEKLNEMKFKYNLTSLMREKKTSMSNEFEKGHEVKTTNETYYITFCEPFRYNCTNDRVGERDTGKVMMMTKQQQCHVLGEMEPKIQLLANELKKHPQIMDTFDLKDIGPAQGVFVEYNGGERVEGCARVKERRRNTKIAIVCDKEATGTPKITYLGSQDTNDPHLGSPSLSYLFKINHISGCTTTKVKDIIANSAATVVLWILLVLFLVALCAFCAICTLIFSVHRINNLELQNAEYRRLVSSEQDSFADDDDHDENELNELIDAFDDINPALQVDDDDEP